MKIIVAGIGTEVGKTVASAVLATLLGGDYWKPIQCGPEDRSDTTLMATLLDEKAHRIYPAVYSFKTPVSPHQAARLENNRVDLAYLEGQMAFFDQEKAVSKTNRPLVIETVGGIYTPLTTTTTSMELFKSWPAQWVLVSKHYLGSINHTLLTIEALKKCGITPLGLIFNGEPRRDSEEAILTISGLPLLGRLLPEAYIDINIIQRYAKQWHPHFRQIAAS